MDLILLYPILGTFCIALIGWLFTYIHAKIQDARKSKLDLVSRKLKYLYGPLYARILSGDTAWKAFKAKCWPAHGQDYFFAEGYETTEAERLNWMQWMTTIFHPNNKEIQKVIIENFDLVDGENIPEPFLEVISHIVVYDSVLKKWEQGEYTEYTSINDFPHSDLRSHVEPTFRRLRAEQVALSASRKSAITSWLSRASASG